MKQKLAFASLLVLSACGTSREAMLALEQMNIRENSLDAPISYASQSGFGNDVTLSGVELRAPAEMLTALSRIGDDNQGGQDGAASEAPASAEASKPVAVAKAEKLTFKGLTLKDGKPIARDVVLNNITPAMPLGPVNLTLGSVSFEGMNEATGRYITGLISQEQDNAVPAFEQWGFGKAAINGLKLNGTIPAGEGEGGNFEIELGELSFANLEDLKLGVARLAGVKGSLDIPGAPPVIGTFDLGDFRVSGINTKLYGEQVMASVSMAMGGEPADYAELYKNYSSPLESGIDRVDWTGMNIDMSGLKFDVSEAHSSITRNADGVAIGADMPRFTMKMTADASGGSLGAMGLMMLAMGGYDKNEVELFMEGAASFDPAKDYTRWNNYNLGVTDLFDVKMSGGIIGLHQAMPSLMSGIMGLAEMSSAVSAGGDEEEESDADTESDGSDGEDAEESQDAFDMGGMDPATLMSLMMGIMPLQLTDLDLSITDAKLLDLLMQGQAISAGQSLQDYRTDLVAIVSASAQFMTDAGVDAAIAQELTTAVSGFVAGPGTLRIQLKPQAPLGVMSALSAPITKDSLGFSATFTPAAVPAAN